MREVENVPVNECDLRLTKFFIPIESKVAATANWSTNLRNFQFSCSANL